MSFSYTICLLNQNNWTVGNTVNLLKFVNFESERNQNSISECFTFEITKILIDQENQSWEHCKTLIFPTGKPHENTKRQKLGILCMM